MVELSSKVFMTREELQKELKVCKTTACNMLKKNIDKDFVVKIGNKYVIDREKFFKWYYKQNNIEL